MSQRNIRLYIPNMTVGLDGIPAVDISSMPLSDNYTVPEQVSILWALPHVLDINGAEVALSTLTTAGIYEATLVPTSAWYLDRNAPIIKIDNDVLMAAAIVDDGNTYYRPTLSVTAAAPLFLNRTTPVENKQYTASFNDKMDSDSLNSNAEQMLFRVQEVFAAASALLELAVYTGNLGNVDNISLEGLLDTITSDAAAAGPLRWDGTTWVNTLDAISAYDDVDTTGATTNQALTWDGSNFVAQNQQSGPLANVNSVNGASGVVTLATSDLTNDSGFITSGDLPTANSAFTNDANYVTAGTAPVTSVNGDSGGAVLSYLTGLEGFTDVIFATPPVDGDELVWDGTTWVNGVSTDVPDTPWTSLPVVYRPVQGYAYNDTSFNDDDGIYTSGGLISFPLVPYTADSTLTVSVTGFGSAQTLRTAYSGVADDTKPWESFVDLGVPLDNDDFFLPGYPKWLTPFMEPSEFGYSTREAFNFADNSDAVCLDPSTGLEVDWHLPLAVSPSLAEAEQRTGNYHYNPYTNLYKPEYTITIAAPSRRRVGDKTLPNGKLDTGTESEWEQYVGTWFSLNTGNAAARDTFNPGSNGTYMEDMSDKFMGTSLPGTYNARNYEQCESPSPGVVPMDEIWRDMEDITGGVVGDDLTTLAAAIDMTAAAPTGYAALTEGFLRPYAVLVDSSSSHQGKGMNQPTAFQPSTQTISGASAHGFVWVPDGPGAQLPSVSQISATQPELMRTSQLPFGEVGQPTIADWLLMDAPGGVLPASFDAWNNGVAMSAATWGTGGDTNWRRLWDFSTTPLILRQVLDDSSTDTTPGLWNGPILPALNPSTYAETLLPEIDYVDGSGGFQFVGPCSEVLNGAEVTYTYTKKSDAGTTYHPDAT